MTSFFYTYTKRKYNANTSVHTVLNKKTTTSVDYEKLIEHYNVSQTILNRYKKVVETYDYKSLVEQRELEVLPEFKSDKITYAWYLSNK
jgi:hypothetical protein